MTINRRSVLKYGAAAAAGLALPGQAALANGEFEGRSLVFATWGGDYERGQVAAYVDTFVAGTGANVVLDGPVSAERVRVMLEGGAADWQVIVVGPSSMYHHAAEGELAEVDTSIVDLSQLPEAFHYTHGVAVDVAATVLAFSTEAFPQGAAQPQTWADFFDLETFPGTRMISSSPTSMIEIALLADGVEPSELYPLDVERALAKLDTIKDSLVFYSGYSQGQQMLVDGVAVMGPIVSNRVYTAANGGANVSLSWEQNLLTTTPVIVPANAEDKALCWAMVNNMLDPENQAIMTNATAIGPTNPAAMQYVDEALLPWMPSNEENLAKSIVVDVDYWGGALEKNITAWQEWMLL